MHNSGLPMRDYHKSESDPVYFQPFSEYESWGFFNETWTDFYGGYSSIEGARAAMLDYCKKHDLL